MRKQLRSPPVKCVSHPRAETEDYVFDGHATQSLGVLPAPNDAYRYDAAVDVVPEHAAAQRAGERTHAHPHTHTHTHRRTHAAH